MMHAPIESENEDSEEDDDEDEDSDEVFCLKLGFNRIR